MGQLLIDVLTLEKEGLVGFTEIGEQVPLSTPNLGVWAYHHLAIGKAEEEFMNRVLNLIKKSDEKAYFKLGKAMFDMDTLLMAYNVYRRRA